MKLGELKAKIRATKGTPIMRVALVPGPLLTVPMMKTLLMAYLDERYPGGKATETGLTFDVTGDEALLRAEAGAGAGTVQTVAAEPIAAFEVVAVRPQVASATSLLLDEAHPTGLLLDLDEPTGLLLDLDEPAAPAAPARSSTLLDF